MPNPFLDRIKNRGNNGHGKLSEKKAALSLGARLQPNSGAMRGAKSDATLKGFRLEMKSSIHQTLPVELGWLVKITKEALSHGQTPAVVLTFVDREGNPVMKQNARWILLPEQSFLELTS